MVTIAPYALLMFKCQTVLLSGAMILSQSETGIDGHKEVLHIPKSSSISELHQQIDWCIPR